MDCISFTIFLFPQYSESPQQNSRVHSVTSTRLHSQITAVRGTSCSVFAAPGCMWLGRPGSIPCSQGSGWKVTQA